MNGGVFLFLCFFLGERGVAVGVGLDWAGCGVGCWVRESVSLVLRAATRREGETF